MAGTIKGITIQLGADTTKLSTALNSANRAIRQTQTELRKVESALKINPTNINLLKDKQVMLNDKIADTKTKLEAMKQAQAKLDAQGVDKNTKEYQKLKTEIDVCEEELKNLNKQAREFGSVGAQMALAVGEKFKTVGEKLTSVGKSLTTSVTLPLVAVGTIGVKKFAEVDKTMQLTNKTMNNTAEEAEHLDTAMKDAAANSTFGMSEAATATLNFARAGLSAEEAASALAPAMNLAAGEGGNLDTVSAGLVATINGFGGSFDDATTYADVFANACNSSALDVDSLSESMSVAAPIFAAAGYSVNDAALYMGVMANAGIDASTAANALKTGMARLVSPSAEAKSWMDKLNISITNADGSMKDSVTVQKELHDAFAGLSESEQIAAASAIFGKNQMSNWLALINTAPSDVDSLSNSLKKEGTTAEMSAAMMSGFGGALEKLKSTADVAATSFGEALAPMINKVADKLQKAADWFNHLDKSQRETIATIAVVIATIGPLLVIIGKIVSAVGTIITLGAKLVPIITSIVSTVKGVISAMQTAQAVMALTAAAGEGMFASLTAGVEAFFTAIEANPIGLVITAIVALVAAIGYAVYTLATEESQIKSVEEASAALEEANANLTEAHKGLADAIDQVTDAQKKLDEVQNETGENGEELFNQVRAGTLTYTEMSETQRRAYKTYLELAEAQKQLEEQQNKVTESTQAANFASLERQLAIDKENGSMNTYKNTVVEAFNASSISAEQAQELLGKAMAGMSDQAKMSFMQDIPDAIKSGLNIEQYETFGQKLINTFGLWSWTTSSTQAQSMQAYRQSTTDELGRTTLAWQDNLGQQLSQIMGKSVEFRDAGNGLVQMVIDGVEQGEPRSKDEMAKLASDAIYEVSKQETGAETAGENLINGINNGIGNERKQSGVFSTIREFGSKLLKNLADSLEEKSPSKATKEMGEFLLKGLGIGIEDEENSVLKQIADVGKNIVTTFNDELSQGLGQVKTTMGELSSEVTASPFSVDYSKNISWINQGSMFDEPRQIQYQDNASRDLLSQIMNLMGQYMGATPIVVNQTINARETSYAEQQREAAYELKQIARSLV